MDLFEYMKTTNMEKESPLAARMRPRTLDEVVGQEHIERTLKNAIEQNKVSHAYLFCGPRGTGKTTMARILAKALLCEKGPTTEPDGTCPECIAIANGTHPDVYELDAASRTGVDNVREEIISRVNYAPTRGAWKVYIIDEVHMLSTAAFNALLKTLEEPPSHVVFILCTTDPQKVPETIHSRCQRFDFHRISTEAIVSRLGAICVKEGVEFEGEALDLIAYRSDGGMRNALTSLEQLIAFGDGMVIFCSQYWGKKQFAPMKKIIALFAALVLLAGYLLVGVALPVWSAKRGDRAAREYRQALADTNSYVLESLRGLKDTLQYQDTAARAEGITAHSEMLGEKQKAMKYREGLTVAITNTLILLTVLAVLGVSLNLYQNGKMGVEGVLVCTLSALSSFGPVVALANLGASLTQVFASADRVLDLLDEQPVTADVTDGTDTAFAGAAAEHVNFAYANEEVLHDLSLTIPEKKVVGITGRSGSGKSTFLRLLMRFWDVSSGSIRFGAEDIRRVNTAALREQESLVTQETELFDDTIENNIRIAKRDATREEVEAACKKAALDGFIHSLPKGYG